MLLNKDIALVSPPLLFVPYDPHHVPLYHSWMSDPYILAATASEPLTLTEEYENQQSWRTSPDKLTFIIARAPVDDIDAVTAGKEDAKEFMLGDVNVFLTEVTLNEDLDDESQGFTAPGNGCCFTPDPHTHSQDDEKLYTAEIDMMLAAPTARNRGLGTHTLRTLLSYLATHEADIVREAAGGFRSCNGKIMELEARIKQENAASLRVFEKMGFAKRGGVNYFGEIKMVRGAGWREDKMSVCEVRYERLR